MQLHISYQVNGHQDKTAIIDEKLGNYLETDLAATKILFKNNTVGMLVT